MRLLSELLLAGMHHVTGISRDRGRVTNMMVVERERLWGYYSSDLLSLFSANASGYSLLLTYP